MGKNKDTFSHNREGKSQVQRFIKNLNPDSFELNDFDAEDWFLFAQNFAKHVNYFESDNNNVPAGNWETFFKGDGFVVPRRESVTYKIEKENIASYLAAYEKEGTLTPHLTLFICFLKLLDFSKTEFNNITKRHLDFYYNDVLQIQKREATPDSVYAIFELAKKVAQEKIPGETLLKGRKDNDGKTLVYKTEEDLIANQTQVVALKSFLKDSEKKELKKADVANSLDGLGKALNEDSNYWWPFGYNSDEANFDELQNAELGFSIASPILNLKEGERKITVQIDFQNNSDKLQDILDLDTTTQLRGFLNSNLKVLCSGEEEWLSDIDIDYVSNTVAGRREILKLGVTLPKDFPAIVAYNKDILFEKFETEYPVIRFIIDGNDRFDLYEALSKKTVKAVEVDVDVKGVKSLVIENDNSILNSEKAFYPFSAQPIKDSNFYIKSEEVFSKRWNNVDVTINWKDTPNSIKDLYEGYVFQPNQNITKGAYEDLSTSIVSSDSYFKATTSVLNQKEWELKSSNVQLFTNSDEGYRTQFSVNNSSSAADTSEAIRLTLNQSALQDVYPKAYTLALTSDSPDKIVPNEPYIPIAESIEVNYTATEKISDLSRSNSERVQLFHEDIFGQYTSGLSKGIVPQHSEVGEFYIGLNATPNQTVSILIQALEGSESPFVETFSDDEKINWEILNNNSWEDLSENVVFNETERFLNSGIVKLKIPKTINKSNTRISDGLVWVKATINRDPRSVCKLAGVYTQAVLATLQDNGNELSHLQNGLEAESIEKLLTRGPRVKSVKQPYNSFNGAPKESDLEFYRRVSERLRHKNRAVTQWDYEQLILQQFPDIFKTKCLNHTSDTSFMSPGDVTVMVVPNIKNKNAFDIYQPRVSQRKLNQIQDYVNQLNTLHVNAKVINPDYQEAKVIIDVKFYDQYDEAFYTKQLNEDITKYISPWAFDETEDITFDARLNTNELISYLEQLHYVDYINNIQVQVDKTLQNKTLIKSDPKSILVSAKQHNVTVANHICI